MSNTEFGGFNPASDDSHLLRDELLKRRSPFTAGRKIRMNVVPVFLCVFVPWAVFVFVYAICAFSMLYTKPLTAVALLCLVTLFCIAVAYVAWSARRYDPEPTWYTYLAIALFIALLWGLYMGLNTFYLQTRPNLQLKDMKVARGVDASRHQGSSVMDAGVIYFSPGNAIDGSKSGHFKIGTLFCVAPLITNSTPPETQSYDFWVAGKDCCAIGASDFRCGDWVTQGRKHGAVRLIDEADLPFYRLAVQQAMTTYNIMSEHPIFLEWTADPLLDISIKGKRAFRSFLCGVVTAFIFFLFAALMAMAKFAWLGRGVWKPNSNAIDMENRHRPVPMYT